VRHESRRTAPPAALLHGETDLVAAANAGFADPQFRETVREMHRQKYSLVRMVTDLGLDDDLTDNLRQVIENLSPDVVEEIRATTLAMLDRREQELPLDCELTREEVDAGAPVTVAVTPAGSGGVIRVRRA
jgi:hypothetical protein